MTYIIYCISVHRGGWQIALAILSVCHCHFGKRQTNYFVEWSSKDEFRVWRMELHYSLVLWQQILLYLLPDGSRVNRLWLGLAGARGQRAYSAVLQKSYC